MMKFLLMILCFSSSQPLPSLPGIYYQHSQVCSGSQALDKKWKLDLKKDSSFVYTIQEYTTKNSKDSIYKASGSWTISQDTITLKTYTKPYLYQFVIKPDTLLPIGEKEQLSGGFFMKLDYLSKIGDN